MPFAYRLGHALDFGTIGHVAGFVLGSDLACDLDQPLLPASKQDELPTAPGKAAGDGGPDPARAAGDDSDRTLFARCIFSAQSLSTRD